MSTLDRDSAPNAHALYKALTFAERYGRGVRPVPSFDEWVEEYQMTEERAIALLDGTTGKKD